MFQILRICDRVAPGNLDPYAAYPRLIHYYYVNGCPPSPGHTDPLRVRKYHTGLWHLRAASAVEQARHVGGAKNRDSGLGLEGVEFLEGVLRA